MSVTEAGVAGLPGGAAGAPGSAAGGGGVTGAAGAGGAQHTHADHCVDGYAPQPSDDTMKDGPAEFYPAGNMDPSLVDLTVQPEVLSWMKANLWEAAHVEWLYLKASGQAAAAGCMPSSSAQCISATMPPSASGKPALSAAELDTLRKWIQDGAKGPS
jgi:hypothetical protein